MTANLFQKNFSTASGGRGAPLPPKHEKNPVPHLARDLLSAVCSLRSRRFDPNKRDTSSIFRLELRKGS